MVYVTGDTHGDIKRFSDPRLRSLKKGDTLIICGDFGFIWDGSNMESPKWLIEAFSEGKIWKERGSYWIHDLIKGCAVKMDPIWVILRNENGDIKYSSLETFAYQFIIVPKYN